NALAFTDYAGTAYYPNNGPATLTGSFQLPGTFCAMVYANQTTYYRAHALSAAPGGLPGTLSSEKVITVGAQDVDFTQIPPIAAANSNTTVCWKGSGTGNSPHTAVHTDSVSHPNSTLFSDYAGTAYYPNNGPATLNGTFALPGPFCADVTMPSRGTLYVVPHAVSADKGLPGELGKEIAIKVA